MSGTIKDFKAHFDYLTSLKWEGALNKHVYQIRPKTGTLELSGKVNSIEMGRASTLDRFIWDELGQKGANRWCDCLTLWTKELEFNVLLFGENDTPTKLRCAYFEVPDRDTCKVHLSYWGATKATPTTPTTPTIAIPSTKARKTENDASLKLNEAIDNAAMALAGAKEISGIVGSKDSKWDDYSDWLQQNLPQLVVWNRFELKTTGKLRYGKAIEFDRTYAYSFDPFRMQLQTIPVPSSFFEKDTPFPRVSLPNRAAARLYRQVLWRYPAIAGRGSPMKHNLLTLASLLADPNIRVALVTGEPGTGKENLCKAMYYGDKLRQPLIDKPEAIFLQTTAGNIQNAMHDTIPKMPQKFLSKELAGVAKKVFGTRPLGKLNSPVLLIDELNKAKQEFLAAMLRPLEQGETELGTENEPKFILAASQHIEELAKNPPQDFWTRVSHQLRVSHPLSRVSEEDGEAFLASFFYSQWWSFIKLMIRGYTKRDSRVFVKAFLGRVSGGVLEPSVLCEHVKDEFLNSLIPLVSRDTLSVRGARSILSQVFARLSWFVRFQKPLGDPKKLDEKTENEVARLVNSAVQDVMAILNPARATPAGLETSKGPK
jgi:hypothetical protein